MKDAGKSQGDGIDYEGNKLHVLATTQQIINEAATRTVVEAADELEKDAHSRCIT